MLRLRGGDTRKKRKKKGILGFFGMTEAADADSDDDSDDEAAKHRGLDQGNDYGGVSDDGSENESEEYDPEADDGDDAEEYEDYVDAFRPGDYNHPGYAKEPIERLGPEDIRELDETVTRMSPKYKNGESK